MLQLIRDRAQGILVWTIVGLIIITFALFGLSSYLSDTSKVNVATVNGAEISQTDFLRAYQNYQDRLQRMLGKNFRPELFNEEMVKKEVLEALIRQELLNQELDSAGFRAAPEQVMRQISSMEAFQDESKQFSPERYKQVLSSQRINSLLFERQIGQDIAEQQLFSGMLASAFVTDAELNQYARLQGQKRDIAYLLFPKARYLKKITPSEADIDAYYEAHRSEFTTPEQVSVAYLELSLDELAKEFDVGEADIKQHYQQNRSNYVEEPEQRKARHILIKVDDKVDDDTAKNKLAELKTKLDKGADFVQLAREHSQDIGSAKQGGDLGYFGKGVMDNAFEEAAFSLNKGEVSEPVRSRFGYHLIKLEDVREEKVQPLKAVHEKIKHDLQLQQAEQVFYENVDKLNNLSYEIPDSLEPVAAELGLKVKTSPLFSRQGGKELFANPKLVSAAFSDEVLNEGRNSQLLEIADTRVVVLRIKEHKPEQQQAKTEVLGLIQARLKDEMASEKAKTDVAEALQHIREGKSPEAVAKSMFAEWNKAGLVTRKPEADMKGLNRQIIEKAFGMPKPTNKQAEYASMTLANGDTAVLLLYAVEDGTAFDDKIKNAEAQKVVKVYANTARTAYIDDLRARADISINPVGE